MTPLEAVPVLQGALAAAGALGVLLWLVPGECRCEKCAFHANERRMAAVRRAEIEHDAAHKGFGYRDGDRDSMR